MYPPASVYRVSCAFVCAHELKCSATAKSQYTTTYPGPSRLLPDAANIEFEPSQVTTGPEGVLHWGICFFALCCGQCTGASRVSIVVLYCSCSYSGMCIHTLLYFVMLMLLD